MTDCCVDKYLKTCSKNRAENLVMSDFCINTHTHTHTSDKFPPALCNDVEKAQRNKIFHTIHRRVRFFSGCGVFLCPAMGIAPCRTSFCTATPTKHETVKATLAVVHAKPKHETAGATLTVAHSKPKHETVGVTLAVVHINNDITIKAKLI